VAACDYDVAKDSLLAALYGAQTDRRWDKSQLGEWLGAVAFKRVVTDPMLAPSFTEVRRVGRVVLKHAPRTPGGLIRNTAGHFINPRVENANVQVAHVLQGAEARILLVCLDVIGGDLVLPGRAALPNAGHYPAGFRALIQHSAMESTLRPSESRLLR
jgi:hypothetical protein